MVRRTTRRTAGQDPHEAVTRTHPKARTNVTQSVFHTSVGVVTVHSTGSRTVHSDETTEVLHEPTPSQSRGGSAAEDGCTSPRSQRAAHIHSELDAVAAQVSAGYEPDEVHEPGRAWVPAHHHDAGKVKSANGSDTKRHWKLKMWKRRTNMRKAKAQAIRIASE